MHDIEIQIIYDIEKDTFEINGNVKDPKSIVTTFLSAQIGAGEDKRPAINRDKYTILINLDLTEDTFFTSDNCGNKGLRDGILLRFVGG